MTRLCRARTAALLGVVALLTAGAYAQSWQQYSLSSNASIVGGDYLGAPALRVDPDGSVRETVRTFQLYRDDLADVEISINLDNEGEDSLFFNSGTMERAMRFRLFSMDEVTGEPQQRAVRVTMRGVLDRDGRPFITLPDQLMFAEGKGKGGVVWIVALTQPDGRPFAPGRYRFEIELHDIRSAIVTATGDPLPNAALQPWSGVTRGNLALVLTAPSTPAEVARMYEQRGELALDRRQFEEAVALFRQAVDANPSDAGRPLQFLGGTYLRMGRYADAVPVLEPLPMTPSGVIQSQLALAYVGAGQEAAARELLRRGGRSEAQVVAELERLRERVKQQPAR